MNCTETLALIDDSLDGTLPQVQQRAVEVHLEECAECRQEWVTVRRLQEQLRELPVASPSSGFVDRVLRVAVERNIPIHKSGYQPGNQRPGNQRPSNQRPSNQRLTFAVGFGGALAAGLALLLVIGLFPSQEIPQDEGSIPGMTIALHATRNIRLVFSSPRDLLGAKVSIRMPAHIDLVGYAGKRELVWHTDLVKGANLLTLPVVALRPESGQIIARIEHGNKVKTLRINLRVKNDGISESKLPYLNVV